MSTELRRSGVILLNRRINMSERGDGKLVSEYQGQGVSVWNGRHPNWTVVRKAPRAKTWAKSNHGSAKVFHRIRYQLTATHRPTGVAVVMTAWACGARANSEITIGERPESNSERCWPCDRPITIPRPTSHD